MSQKPTHKELKKKVQELEHLESGHNQSQSRIHTSNYLEVLNNSLQDAIFTIKMPERTIEYSNKAVEQIFGYSAECIYGKTTEMLYPDTSSYHEFARKLQRAKDGKDEHLQTEHLLKKKSGELFTAEISLTFIRSKEDVSHVVSIVRDIRDRKLLEESLQKVLALYEAVVEDQTECISRFKPDGTFIFANKAYCNFVGISEAEITDNTWSVVVHEDDEGHINDLLQTMTPENPTIVIENRVFNTVGEERWMQFVNRGFFNKNGHLTETQSVGRDITVLKEKESLLLASSIRLENCM